MNSRPDENAWNPHTCIAPRRSASPRFGPKTPWLLIREAAFAGSPRRRGAFDSLYRSYHPHVRDFIQRQGVPSHLSADDIAQQFFLRLFTGKDLARLTPRLGSFRGWLRRAVRNFFLNECKANYGRRLDVGLEHAAGVAAGLPEQSELERLFSEYRDEFVVYRAYEHLQRAFPLPWDAVVTRDLYLRLSSQDGVQSDAELAARLDTSELALRQRRHRLRKKFKEFLEKEQARWSPESVRIAVLLAHLAAEITEAERSAL